MNILKFYFYLNLSISHSKKFFQAFQTFKKFYFELSHLKNVFKTIWN